MRSIFWIALHGAYFVKWSFLKTTKEPLPRRSKTNTTSRCLWTAFRYQIVSVNVTTLNQRKVEILDPNLKEVEFSYSVDWIEEPQLAWADRMLRYADSRFIPSTFEIHWLSIINSFVLVLLLTIFLTIILMRVLKNDVSRYMEIDNDEILEEESGWKLIHGDVFRFPSHINLLAALIGSGVQLCATTALLLICALSGVFRATKRGSILTALLLIYVLTSFITGYISARLYRQMGGKNWTWNIITAALVFPGPLALVWSFLNSLAWSNASTAALPAATVFIILGLFIFVSFPLSVVGGIAGRNSAGDFDAPCRTKKVAREIPKDGPCFQHPVVQALLAGFLPFSAIYIELHYIFNSIWGHKIYTLFGILVLAFIMLFMVTSLITIALIYFQLTREDHRWWWRTFLNGGATGLFILAYSFFYYFQRSEMDGFFQASYFFGYMAIVSYAFFIMLGSVGFLSSLSFVRHIYSVIKTD
ncbi:Nonaspanin (TM9SF) [Nannochloropsis gaditana]|uniref:Transmembrane 9 superfamily member n=1 Tax=Nannochloropsis gaditana TaxID=72520 RepID=W7TPI4_9STRA|nr:Nonaspanin (TM9SF) [Nannochloropsis gaditana]